MILVKMVSFCVYLCTLVVCMTTLSIAMPMTATMSTAMTAEPVDRECVGRQANGESDYELVRSNAAMVVFVVDESFSAGDDHGVWLRSTASILNSSLVQRGFGTSTNKENLVSVFGFGSADHPGGHFLENDEGETVFNSAYAALARLEADGASGDGYAAIDSAARQLHGNARVQARKRIMVLVTDGDRQVSVAGAGVDGSAVRARLAADGWDLHVIVNEEVLCDGAEAHGLASGGVAVLNDDQLPAARLCRGVSSTGLASGSTHRDYTALALELGGTAWDLNKMRRADSNLYIAASSISRTVNAIPELQCRTCNCIGNPLKLTCQTHPNQEECKCMEKGGNWTDATCQASTPIAVPAKSCQQVVAESGARLVSLPCSASCGQGVQVDTYHLTGAPLAQRMDCADATTTARTPCTSPACATNTCPPQSITYRPLPPSTRSANIVIVLDQTFYVPLYKKLVPGLVAFMENQLTMNRIGNGESRNLYSLVGFGFGDDASSHAQVHQTASGSNQFPASSIQEMSSMLTQSTSHKEDGYLAIHKALQDINLGTSTDTANIIIVISNEDRDVLDANLQRSTIKQELRSRNVVPHFVVFQSFDCAGDASSGVGAGPYGKYFSPSGECTAGRLGDGFQTTADDYSSLALELQGSVWNIESLAGGNPGATAQFLRQVVRSAHAATSPTCQRCDCRGSERCQEVADSRACHCLAYGGKWSPSLGACRA